MLTKGSLDLKKKHDCLYNLREFLPWIHNVTKDTSNQSCNNNDTDLPVTTTWSFIGAINEFNSDEFMFFQTPKRYIKSYDSRTPV